MESTNRPPRFIVDASVATKWHVRDEPHTDRADDVLKAFRDNRVELGAPDCIWYEVTGAIRKALLTGRVTEKDARDAVIDFAGLGLPTVGSNGLIVAGYDLARRFGCSVYDGIYLAMAEAVPCPFVHADLRLHHALGGRFGQELWIDDWSL